MSTQIARAVQLHDEARLAEEQGNVDRAEVLYVESKEIFLQNGGAYLIDTALIMNAIASMKEKYGDFQGALRAAEKAIQILENYGDTSLSRKADEIRVQTWLLLARLRWQLAHYEKAEQILLYALNHTSTIFGESDERTVSIREQLRTLKC
jgi:tetratricopeptide (TPR) repeat protein